MAQKLTSLRSVLCKEEGNVKQFFDEFVRQDEWDMASMFVCDYLLERTAQAAAAEVIQQIEALHEAMAVVDTCVADLRRKAGLPVGKTLHGVGFGRLQKICQCLPQLPSEWHVGKLRDGTS